MGHKIQISPPPTRLFDILVSCQLALIILWGCDSINRYREFIALLRGADRSVAAHERRSVRRCRRSVTSAAGQRRF